MRADLGVVSRNPPVSAAAHATRGIGRSGNTERDLDRGDDDDDRR